MKKIIYKFYGELRYFFLKYCLKDDLKYTSKRFKKKLSRKIELESPTFYNDKLQFMKLYDHNSLYTKLSDKLAVREYVKEKIGAEYLNELICVFDYPRDINFNILPDKFVMKLNHGSGYNVLCYDKAKLNKKDTIRKINNWFKKNYYYYEREWQYKNITPKIIVEKYLEDSDFDLKDYKFFCFDGVPKYIQVDFNRFTNHRRNIYDLNWNFIDVSIQYPNDINAIIEKPDEILRMIELAKKLSANLRHARVDFYYVKNKIYFGEITFTHGAGLEKFVPLKYEKDFGDYLDLTNII